MHTLPATFSRRRRAGFSLVEIAMVLAIIALLVAGILLFFNNAQQMWKTNDATEEMAFVLNGITSMYQDNYQNFDTDTLTLQQLQSGMAIPNRWVASSGTGLQSAYGRALAYGDSTFPGWDLVIENLPYTACISVANTAWSTLSNAVIQVVIGGSEGSPSAVAAGGVGSIGQTPAQWLAASQTACQRSGSNLIRIAFLP